MTTQLFVARLRGSTADAPKFTSPTTAEELMAALARYLPADLVYALVPSTTGYALREAGRLTLNFESDLLPAGYQDQPAPPPPSSLEAHAVNEHDLAGIPLYSPQEARSEEVAPAPLPTPRPNLKPSVKANVAPKTRKRRKAKAKQTDPDIPDSQLPSVTSFGGTMQTTGFTVATPAEQAAASHFGKRF